MTEKELILSEERARRLWERAAQLQAEASEKEERDVQREMESRLPPGA